MIKVSISDCLLIHEINVTLRKKKYTFDGVCHVLVNTQPGMHMYHTVEVGVCVAFAAGTELVTWHIGPL